MTVARILAVATLALIQSARTSAEEFESTTLVCASSGARTVCPADTSHGAVLVKTRGAAQCTFGTSWGYAPGEIWVDKGCVGEFELGPSPTEREDPIETWGALQGGQGFLVGRTTAGELWISAYALIRYLNQWPGRQIYFDHLGREQTTDGREDIFAHRIMVHFKGWLGLPKLRYQLTLWTVNTTDQKALFATIGYQFHRKFSLYAGLNALPGTRTLQGSHPYWLGNDRVMADEYFRPYFTHGVWASGEVLPGLWYQAMIGNNLSSLGIKATQLNRHFAKSASVWWMPTTHEFGPNGAFDDWEYHEKLATRFGISGTTSREDRFTALLSNAPENTTIRLADATNVFDVGALAEGVTINQLSYRLLSADAGFKYKGVFLEVAYFQRWLQNFNADGPLPVDEVVDKGFYVQAAGFPIKKKLELYLSTSYVFGDDDAGFKEQHEYLGGLNWFPVNTRDIRLNSQLIWVNRSPVSSTFGYYTGGLKGYVGAVAFSINF